MSKQKIKGKFAENFGITIEKPKPNITFCFSCINTGKYYGIKYFLNNSSIATDFFEKLQELSIITPETLLNRKKEQGIETIPTYQINRGVLQHLNPNEMPEKVFILRFSNQKCRILGNLSKHILSIYAFDFDYSAYKH